jgi:hypothetical protein
MDPLNQLLRSDQRETLQFFFAGLRDVTADEPIDEAALLYNASILAHFASTSVFSPESLPTPRWLGDVFDRFVLDNAVRHDTEMMEWAAAQCLLFTGFFSDQMRRRHNLDWYGHLGADFYNLAASSTEHIARKRMMGRMSEEFQDWRRRYLKLSRELRDLPYLLPSPF